MLSVRTHKETRTAVAVFVLAANLFSCAAGISREELLSRMHEQRSPLIVDVRSQAEYGRDHLPGAIHVPFYSIASRLGQMQFPKDREFVLYCEHGPRAGMASLWLHIYGYDSIYSLEGHMKGWRRNQFPIENINQ